MLKLTAMSTTKTEPVIRCEGRLDLHTVTELRSMLASYPSLRGVQLDLGGLTSMDNAARDFLVGLRDAGCRLQGGSLYINRLIEEAQL